MFQRQKDDSLFNQCLPLITSRLYCVHDISVFLPVVVVPDNAVAAAMLDAVVAVGSVDC